MSGAFTKESFEQAGVMVNGLEHGEWKVALRLLRWTVGGKMRDAETNPDGLEILVTGRNPRTMRAM